MMLQSFLYTTRFLHQKFHALRVSLRHFGIVGVHLRLKVKKIAEGRLQNVSNGLSLFQNGMLI